MGVSLEGPAHSNAASASKKSGVAESSGSFPVYGGLIDLLRDFPIGEPGIQIRQISQMTEAKELGSNRRKNSSGTKKSMADLLL